MFDREKLFVKFLIKNNLYSAYYANIADISKISSKPSNYVRSAFNKYDSPEGVNFWSEVNNKWRKICRALDEVEALLEL